ncbi:serine/threonine-protein phosphatase 6 regulatory ankyrin repeat subunit B-like [Uloborus diversus]|uniref:serine/threonine-protein phosphatase 6 regulatory ankyrin repeat subunit B-like n=1 Tax=Uloborus diversus TaxID=327109 RepID=UPI0024092512|nr:serine/threonine-protein phosphatase 6 regulatory ankyrin repeat subunit B-like [Uloborus diversus]
MSINERIKKLESERIKSKKEGTIGIKVPARSRSSGRVEAGTKLHHAILYENSTAARDILKNKESNLIDEKDKEGNTALHLAATYGLKGLKMLLDAKANTRLQNSEGFTPLHCALIWRRVDVAMILLDYDAKIDLHDRHGRTPLHIAAEQGDVDIVRRLLASNVNTRLQDAEGHIPLNCALRSKKRYGEKVAQLLLDSDSAINFRDRKGRTPLHWAAQYGKVAAVRKLLRAGAIASLQDRSGSTPLHLALRQERTDAAAVLVDHGGKIDIRDRYRMTPLHWAADTGKTVLVRKLLDAGANTRLRDFQGRTPLHLAIDSKKANAAKALVDSDSEIDHQDWNGETPLLLAACMGYVGVMRKLLDAGADAGVQNTMGRTIIRYSLHQGTNKLLLAANGANDLQDKHGRTALFSAACRKNLKKLESLVFCDVHPHIRTDTLHYPISYNAPETFKPLLSAIALRDIAIDWEDPRVFPLPGSKEPCRIILAQCQAELQRMKEAKVQATNVSYYDLVKNDVSRVALYLEIGDIRWRWAEGVEDFPIYAEWIAFKMKRAEKRRNLYEQCLDCFGVLSEKYSFLPRTVMRIISHHLSERDMRSLVASFKCINKGVKRICCPIGKKC